MADRVDAPMHADEPSRADENLDLAARESQHSDLRAPHDPILTRGQPGKQNVETTTISAGCSTFCTYAVQNVEWQRQPRRSSTFCTHRTTIAPRTRQSRPPHKPDTLSMRS